jgi:hypothetical protein
MTKLESSNLPRARERLQALVLQLEAEQITLAGVAEQISLIIREDLMQRTPMSHAAPRRRTMTKRLAHEILDYKRRHPDMANGEVGDLFNVDGGRVSEILGGRYL